MHIVQREYLGTDATLAESVSWLGHVFQRADERQGGVFAISWPIIPYGSLKILDIMSSRR